jgi:hypothetical protein
LVESIIELYPECKTKVKKSKLLYEVLSSSYRGKFEELEKKRASIQVQEQARKELVHKNEKVTKKIPELEQKI